MSMSALGLYEPIVIALLIPLIVCQGIIEGCNYLYKSIARCFQPATAMPASKHGIFRQPANTTDSDPDQLNLNTGSAAFSK